MKRHWKVEVRIDEELEGWEVSNQFTQEEIEDGVSKALKAKFADVDDVDFVECKVEEEKKDEEKVES